MTEVAIRIAGQDYQDYTDFHCSYGLEQFARQFSIGFSSKWKGAALSLGVFPFEEGAACELLVDGETVLDGFIDDIPVDYDGTSQRFSISGRSWTGHMVDASAVHKTGAWKNADLLTIANDIAAPFGVTCKVPSGVILDEVLEPFRKWAIDQEETAYDCIQRAAKMRGIYLTSDAARNVLMTRATKLDRTVTVLKRGSGLANIIRGRREGRFSERYSEYIIKAQNAGDDTWYAADATSKLFHRARDPQVTSYRPLIIVSDGQGAKPDLALRAAWEMNVRAGRSRRVTYEVNGLHKQEGGVWQANELVMVDDPAFDIQGEMLIASVSLKRSNGGTSTSLELANPLAFDVLTPPKPRVKKKGGWHK
jgi:prophage tail gpP-like protein